MKHGSLQASENQEYLRVRQEDLRELERLVLGFLSKVR